MCDPIAINHALKYPTPAMSSADSFVFACFYLGNTGSIAKLPGQEQSKLHSQTLFGFRSTGIEIQLQPG